MKPESLKLKEIWTKNGQYVEYKNGNDLIYGWKCPRCGGLIPGWESECTICGYKRGV